MGAFGQHIIPIVRSAGDHAVEYANQQDLAFSTNPLLCQPCQAVATSHQTSLKL